jgi:adenylate cyclase
MDSAQDPAASLERELLGGDLKYTRAEVAELAGVPIDRARLLWRALGFADVGDDKIAFADCDAKALRTVEELVSKGVIDAETQVAMTRAMGQSLARLAEWHVSAVAPVTAGVPADQAAAATAARELVPLVESLIDYVWRRHLAAAADRELATAPDESSVRTVAVGFADLVGFTSLTRHVAEDELAALVEEFERVSYDVLAQLGGRVIKNVGDEVMFVADEPSDAAEMALRLAERVGEAANLPDVRVGVALGGVLARLGDIYGEPVNLASRLTSIARPGTVLVDRDLAAALADDPRWRLRRLAPRPVRGYTMLHPTRLQRGDDPPAAEQAPG